MTVQYGALRRTTRRPREGGDVMNMVRDQAVMTTDKAVFDNQTAPYRASPKPDFSNVRGSEVSGMKRRSKVSMMGKK